MRNRIPINFTILVYNLKVIYESIAASNFSLANTSCENNLLLFSYVFIISITQTPKQNNVALLYIDC